MRTLSRARGVTGDPDGAASASRPTGVADSTGAGESFDPGRVG